MENRFNRMEDTVREIKQSVDRMATNKGSGQNGNNININAGGVGVWVCVTVCCMMLVGVGMGAAWMSREFTRYDIALSERKEEADRSQTYLSSIFGRMPQWMREEVEKEASAKLKEKEQKDALRRSDYH